MSAGSWGLSVFAFCTFVGFLTNVRPTWRVCRWLEWPWVRHPIRAIGLLSAFYIGSYTGSLLSASNQPVWSDTTWLSALFLASSISTGLAAIILLVRWKRVGTDRGRHKLESADLWAIGLEFIVFVVFLMSLGAILESVIGTVAGFVLVFGTLLIGLAAPMVIQRVYGERGWSQAVAAACVLAGGLCLRAGAVSVNAELLAKAERPHHGISPEMTRQVGEPGSDPGNHGPVVEPRTKIPEDE
jgi:formate-dependent nitrite reductase membrane component NrfD